MRFNYNFQPRAQGHLGKYPTWRLEPARTHRAECEYRIQCETQPGRVARKTYEPLAAEQLSADAYLQM